MKKLLTQKEVEEMVAAGTDPASISSANGILTPGARDYLRSLRSPGAGAKPPESEPVPVEAVDPQFRWTQGADPKTPSGIEAFFRSPAIEELKRRMCAVGRRMWERGYCDGNSGNLSVRVGDGLLLCAPGMVSKGFMSPEQIGLVDFEGKQLAGRFKCSGHVFTHIGIMKRQPKARACCHAHPAHATAYAVAKVVPPTCLIPEAEVFLGVIGSSPYEKPGSPAAAEALGEAAVDHQAILMENHGAFTWSEDIEDAYGRMENTETYCQTILLASMLGRELQPISGKQARDLIEMRKQLGMSDFRENWSECELCDNSEFRTGFSAPVAPSSCPTATPAPAQDQAGGVPPDPEAEKLVQIITDRIYNGISTS